MRLFLVLVIFLLAIPASAQTFYFDGDMNCSVNETIDLSLIINTTIPLGSIQLNVTFNPLIVKAESVEITGNALPAYTINNKDGFITIGVINLQGISGNIANITFKGVNAGVSPLNIEIVDLTDVNNNPVSGNAISSTLLVTSPTITLSNGTLAVTFKDVRIEAATPYNLIKIDYGDMLKFDISYRGTVGNVRLIDLDTGNVVWKSSLSESGFYSFSIDTGTAGIYPGNYTLVVTAPEDSPSILNIIENAVQGKYVIRVESIHPIISLSLKNPSGKIAKGDVVYVKGKIYGASNANWTLEGPYDMTAGSYEDQPITVVDHSFSIMINTSDLFLNCDAAEGMYELKVYVDDYEVSIVFEIVNPAVEISADKESLTLGQELWIFGVTNVAESGSDCDDEWMNNVTIYIYNNTIADNEYLVYTVMEYVEADGTFEGSVHIPLTWDTGTYLVKSIVYTNTHFSDDDQIFVEIRNPEVHINMDKYVLSRGEKFRIKGNSTLLAGYTIYIEGLDKFSDAPAQVIVYVDSNGYFETGRFRVSPDAPLSTYTIKARVYKPGTQEVLAEDTAKIRIVKVPLNVSIEKTVLTRGEKVKLTGNTTADYVYVYANESYIFEDVAELPSFMLIDVSSCPTLKIPVSDNAFEKMLRVSKTADPGDYELYVFAPANASIINTNVDSQVLIYIRIVAEVMFSIPDSTIGVGESRSIPIMMSTLKPVGSIQLNVTFDPSIIHAESVELGSASSNSMLAYTIDNTIGIIQIGIINMQGVTSGNIANITFKGVNAGVSPLNIEIVDLTDTQNNKLTSYVQNSTLSVVEPMIVMPSIQTLITCCPGHLCHLPTIIIPINIANVRNATGFGLTLLYNPKVVEVLDIKANSSFAGSTVHSNINNSNGVARIVLTNNRLAAIDQKPIVDVTFRALSCGFTYLNLTQVELSDSNFNTYKPVVVNGSIKVSVKGDFNENCKVDIGDVAYVAYMVVGKVKPGLAADFNGNGRVDIGDLAKIAYCLVGKLDEL